MPLTALVAPGPRPVATTPGVPVSSPVAAAISAAAVSVWVKIQVMPRASQAAMISRFEPPPGTPNMWRTP